MWYELTFGIEKSCHAVLAFHNVKGGFQPVADAAILQRAPIHQIGSAKGSQKNELDQTYPAGDIFLKRSKVEEKEEEIDGGGGCVRADKLSKEIETREPRYNLMNIS